jgi:TIR domain-containing protein
MSMNRTLSVNLTPAVFLNYRREDTSGHAGRLSDWLRRHYGNDQVFMDVIGIDPGLDFVAIIERAVSSCEVLIALIGRHWLSITDEQGKRRLDNPEDFVHIEIATALTRNIRVIPILVQGAAMPSKKDLPSTLAKLAWQSALELSDSRWSQDVQRLIEILDQVVTARVEENAHNKAARLARDAERQLKREKFLQSTDGVQAARESLAEIFRYLEEQISSIRQIPNALESLSFPEMRQLALCKARAVVSQWHIYSSLVIHYSIAAFQL